MAYDQALAERIRGQLDARTELHDVTEKKMFGGLSFLVGGHIAVAIRGQEGLLLRAEPDDAAVLTTRTGVEQAVMGGRTMDGWVTVDAAVIAEDDDLAHWLDRGVASASAMPPR